MARPIPLPLHITGMTTTLVPLLQAATGSPPGFLLPLQIILIVGIGYVFLIRPQQKQRKQQEDSLRQLKKGDEIVTSGGIVGRVVHIKESGADGAASRAMEDRITIDSGDARLVVERGKIARIVGGSAAS